ncbi:MAG TPA: hypothetical protein VHE82_04945 [Gemmatimonadaceae bacterium]|nr:hypothetical protein [Gemmatimonadaceae bacterium]
MRAAFCYRREPRAFISAGTSSDSSLARNPTGPFVLGRVWRENHLRIFSESEAAAAESTQRDRIDHNLHSRKPGKQSFHEAANRVFAEHSRTDEDRIRLPGAFRGAHASFSVEKSVACLRQREDARFRKRNANRCRRTARPAI